MAQPAKTRDASVDMAPQLSSLATLKRASRWLSEFSRNVTSQCGEDGLIEKALSLLPELDHWCVEFGAWDGKYASNTFNLVGNLDYSAVLIEMDCKKYDELCSSYPHKERVIFLNACVGWTAGDGLDHLLRQRPIPRNFDVLSVDVDGNDFHIWDATVECRPKLVLIEYNYTMANGVNFSQPADARLQQGSSAAALVGLARKKGYELIAVTRLNLLFVDRQYYDLFKIADNSLEVMRDEEPNYVFFGFDGTVLLAGGCSLEWHDGLKLSAEQIQVLPRILRAYPPSYTFVQRRLFTFYFLMTHPKEGLARLANYFRKWFLR